MIKVDAPLDGLIHRLARRAATLAVAHVTSRALAARSDERRWRQARLLWPLFAKG